MAKTKKIEQDIRTEYEQCLYNANLMTYAVKEFRKQDKVFAWITTSLSCLAVFSWLIESRSAFIASCVIAASQVANLIKPMLPFTKHIHTLNKHCYIEEQLCLEFERLWNEAKQEAKSDDVAYAELHQLKMRRQSNENFDDDADFEYSEKVKELATTETNAALDNKYKK
ncbi:MAG: hypothetical protein KBS69_02085 [Bacteroidales bacterium]|nr:hypothetical protein [Candidatus Colicola caccequi]